MRKEVIKMKEMGFEDKTDKREQEGRIDESGQTHKVERWARPDSRNNSSLNLDSLFALGMWWEPTEIEKILILTGDLP